MRVAMLGNFPFDPNKIPGGVEAVIKNLCVAMAKLDDMDLHLFVCCEETTEQVSIEYEGFKIHYLPGQRQFGNITNQFLNVNRLVKAINEMKPDIVHSHGTGRYVAAANKCRFPTVVTPHGIRFREVVLFSGLKNWIRSVVVSRFEKQVLRDSKYIFSIADYVGKTIAPLSTGKQFPIANPVAPKYFDMETTDTGKTILSVAAVQPRKGHLHLVEAFAKVRKVVPDARLHLIGKVLVPEYAEKVKERIIELGLSDVVDMVGFASDEDLQKAFTSCAVFTLCSAEESSPVSIAEAMTLGKPVVATAVGGVPDLVSPGNTGFLTEFGNVDLIADSLTKVLADPELRAQMGVAARARAERDFHPAAAAQRTVEVYKEILTEIGAKNES
jgi:glycosyltransferase involved in cell wall biosynthesis